MKKWPDPSFFAQFTVGVLCRDVCYSKGIEGVKGIFKIPLSKASSTPLRDCHFLHLHALYTHKNT